MRPADICQSQDPFLVRPAQQNNYSHLNRRASFLGALLGNILLVCGTWGSPGWTQSLDHDDRIRTIPAQSVIAVTLQNPVKFVPEKNGSAYPVTGFLKLPVLDQQGEILAEEESLVTLHLSPENGAALLHADGIVIGNQLIPIETSSILIPGQRDEFLFDSEFVRTPSRLNQISTNLLGVVLDSDGIDAPIRAGTGIGLAILSGLTAPKGKLGPKVVNIEGESVYVLTLKSDIQVKASTIPAFNLEKQQNPEEIDAETSLSEDEFEQ